MPNKSLSLAMIAIWSTTLLLSFSAQTPPPAPAPASEPCPPATWQTTLLTYLSPTAALPTKEPISDCQFHQWSWEAFVWATALDTDGVPRFMKLNTSADLITGAPSSLKKGPRMLKLATRSHLKHGTKGYVEGAGAIVEADGNMLIAQNGYPVYASVHFNDSYLKTANNNLIVTGAFDANTPGDDYFVEGAAVFKATWLALNPATLNPATGKAWASGTYSTQPPAGTYVTLAQVPVLTSEVINGFTVIHPVIPQKLATINVALVGLHVVGYAKNHPEFLWGTFEHKLNAPMTPDNTFTTTNTPPTTSYTFYAGGTPYSAVNLQNQNPGTTPVLNIAAQTLSPVTNVVQENATGGENFSPNGPTNIASLNTASQAILAGQPAAQAVFSNYQLIGTVWLAPNTYNNASQAANASAINELGSVNLANSTAETFQQVATNAVPKNVENCFTCHNATSYTFQSPPHAASPSATS